MGEFCLYKLIAYTFNQHPWHGILLQLVSSDDSKLIPTAKKGIKNKAALSTFIKLTLWGKQKPKSLPHTSKGPQTVPLLTPLSTNHQRKCCLMRC